MRCSRTERASTAAALAGAVMMASSPAVAAEPSAKTPVESPQDDAPATDGTKTAGGPDTEGRPVPETGAGEDAPGETGETVEMGETAEAGGPAASTTKPDAETPTTAPTRVEVHTETRDGVTYVHRRAWFESTETDPATGAVIKREELEEVVEPLEAPPSEGQESEDGAVSRAQITASLEDGLRIAVPVGKHDLWFRPGFSYWVIGQTRRGMTFGADPIRDVRTRLRQQVRLTAQFGWGPISSMVQMQDAREGGLENSTSSNEGNVDLHQGWVRVGGESEAHDLWGHLIVGRQQIWVGTRRLFAERPWNTVGQSFNAIRGRAGWKNLRVDVWGAMLRAPRTFDVDFSGVQQAYRTRGSYVGMGVLGWDPHEAVSVEAMTAWISEDIEPDDLTQHRVIASPGLRVFGTPIKGLRYDAEGYVQVGRAPVKAQRHFAWAAAATVDYTFDAPAKPRLGAGYTIASGAACTGDPDAGEACAPGEGTADFFDFYRRRHGYQGIADQALFRNIRDLEVGLHLQPEARVKVALDYHFFQLQDPKGRWWRVPENLVGNGWSLDNDDHNLGHEMDLVVTYVPWTPLNLQAGYALFVPVGGGVAIAGGDAPQNFAYVRVGARF